MAEKSPIVVSVLDGAFLHLNEVGFPLPLCYHMKVKELHLGSAQWTAKQTTGGFSVSFFWPVDLNVDSKLEKPAKKPRRRRKRKQKKQSVKASPHLGVRSQPLPCSPINEHHHVNDEKHLEVQLSSALPEGQEDEIKSVCSSQPDEQEVLECESSDDQSASTESESSEFDVTDEDVRLAECEEVSFEMKDGIAGVSYSKDGQESWTPVTKRRKKLKYQSKGDNDELLLPSGATVTYAQAGRTPGLSVRTRCTRFWQPVAARTKNKLKLK